MPVTVGIGTPLIVGDPELDELYLADYMKQEHNTFSERNPIVKIRFVFRYPIQHAIVWADIPLENKAIDEGIVCRLPFVRFASPGDVSRFGSYAESLKAAQTERLTLAQQDGDESTAEIILRHMRGEYRRQRLLKVYKRWEL